MIICPHCQTVNDARNADCVRCAAPLGPDDALGGDPFVGRQLGGRFTLQAIIGSGEIGMVYRGLDARTGSAVAVKIIHADVATTHGDELLKSARAVAQLRHAKIAAVIGAAREGDGTTFVVTEFLQGETLKQLVERTGPMGARRAADILFQLCSALAPIHRAGRPHANLKPENVFLLEQKNGADFVKVVDTGSPELFGVRNIPGHGTVITGSPKFFSPEQATGQDVGLASDQFTLGIVGYQLLTGALPFFGATPDQLLTAIAHGQPTPVGERTAGTALPPMLAQIVHRCLEKAPAARYPDLRSLATDLAAVIKGSQAAAAEAPAPPKRKPFGGGRDLSTVVAGPDMLAALGADEAAFEEDDEDRTVMRMAEEAVEVAVNRGGIGGEPTPALSNPPAQLSQLRRAAPSPPTQNSMKAIPEPLAVTGAIDSDDLAAALADATAALDGARGARGAATPARGVRPLSTPPARSVTTPSPMKAAAPSSDLAAALADAARDLGIEDDVGSFDPFGDSDGPILTPTASIARPTSPGAPQPAVPATPSGGIGRPTAAAGPRSSNPNLSQDLLDAIHEGLDSVTGDERQSAPSTAASPLATAADFKALSPDLFAGRGVGGPGAVGPPVSARRGGGGALKIVALLVVLGGGGFGAWWYLNQPEAGSVARPSGPAAGGVAKVASPPKEQVPAADAAVALAAPFTYSIRSEPTKAAVFLGEDRIGETPLEVKIESGEPRDYHLKLEGYATLDHTFDPSAAQPVKGIAMVKLELQPTVAKLDGAVVPKVSPRAPAVVGAGDGEPEAVKVAPTPPKPKTPKKWTPRKKPKADDIKNPFD